MAPLRLLARRLRALFYRNRLDREMQEEMSFHLEERTLDQMEDGLSMTEAHYAARRKFGGREQIKERCRDARGTRWLEEIGQDLKHAARQLRRSPGFTAVAVATLALGIGANTAMFSVCNAVLLRDLPVPEPQRLVFVDPSATFSGGDYTDLKATRSFASFTAYSTANFNLAGAGDPERLDGAQVTADFLPTLGVAPWRGRNFLPEEDREGGDRVVLLSHALWQRKFNGEDEAIGRVVSINGQSHTVVGVLPPGIDVPPGRELFVPLALRPSLTSDYGGYFLNFIARLRPEVTWAAAETEVIARLRRDDGVPAFRKQWTPRLVSARDARAGDARTTLWVMMGAVGLLVLIACSNLANLLLAAATRRQKEIAVRLSLGASRARVVRQFLTESLLLAALGGLAGVALAALCLTVIRATFPAGVPQVGEIGLDGRVLGFTAVTALLAGIFFGTFPALRASQTALTDALKSGGRGNAGGTGQQRVRSALVIAQVMLAVILLTGAGLLVQSFLRLQSVPVGFRPERLLTARLGLPGPRYAAKPQRTAFAEKLIEEIRRQPGLQEAALASRLPFASGNETYRIYKEGSPEGKDSVAFRAVSPDYLRVLGVPLLQGRELTATDTDRSPRVVVINEAMAQALWPGQNPLGQRIQETSNDRAWREVVGVVGSLRHRSKALPPGPEMYVPWSQSPGTQLNLVVRTTVEPTLLAGTLRRAVAAIDPELGVFELRTMEARLSDSVAQPRFRTSLLAVFAGIALLMAAVGLYGVMAYAVSQRTQELGVRMALGARPRDVVAMVVAQGARLALFGVLLGLAGAWALTRVIEKMLYATTPTDPLTYTAVPAVLLTVVVAASWWPARRAAKIDPMTALRCE